MREVDGVRSQGFSRPSLSSEQSSPRELCGHQDEACSAPKSQNMPKPYRDVQGICNFFPTFFHVFFKSASTSNLTE